ncbi:globin domain-containing protein [Clostridium sp.]|uniref:globin domain-containing protein n=1 Tax=Clostridium sp. TaxID=1506 RepID=UPI0026254F8C|nr:globin domain-containing protein [Clostridium sp.]
MLDKKTIDIVKSTVPAIRAQGLEITSVFYKTMFERNPEVKSFFNMDKQDSGEQPKALALTILAAAQNIDNLEAIIPVAKRIGEIHCRLNIKPEHYPIVGENLLIAIKEVLGAVATDEIIDAWGQAYGVIAEVFINIEKEMYAEINK